MDTTHPGEPPSGNDDKQSFHHALESYKEYLRAVARQRLEPTLRALYDTSDVIQEALLEAYRDHQQFRGSTEAEWRSWLRQILIRNLAGLIERHLQTEKRDARRCLPLDGLQEGLMELADPGTSPSEHAERQEQINRVTTLLMCLPSDHREVIILRIFRGLPFEEVAQRMSRTPGAVRVLFVRALGRLREAFGREEKL